MLFPHPPLAQRNMLQSVRISSSSLGVPLHRFGPPRRRIPSPAEAPFLIIPGHKEKKRFPRLPPDPTRAPDPRFLIAVSSFCLLRRPPPQPTRNFGLQPELAQRNRSFRRALVSHNLGDLRLQPLHSVRFDDTRAHHAGLGRPPQGAACRRAAPPFRRWRRLMPASHRLPAANQVRPSLTSSSGVWRGAHPGSSRSPPRRGSVGEPAQFLRASVN